MSNYSRFPFPGDEILEEFQRRTTEGSGRSREQRPQRHYEEPQFGFFERGRTSSRNAGGETSYYSEDEYAPREFGRRPSPAPTRRRSPAYRRPDSPYQSFPQRAQSGPCFYNSEDYNLPEDYRRRRSPSPQPRSGFFSQSPPPERVYSPSPSRAYSPQSSRAYSPPPRRAYSPPPRSTHSSSSFQDENPLGLYTYSDEEPDSIPIAPSTWNNHSSSISREQLISFFKRQGFSESAARAEVDKEFAAQAPTRRAGQESAGPSRAEMRRAERNGGNSYADAGNGYGYEDKYEGE